MFGCKPFELFKTKEDAKLSSNTYSKLGKVLWNGFMINTCTGYEKQWTK